MAIFADKMQKSQEITIHGDGEQTRDFVYVSDVAQACLCAIQIGVNGEVKNDIVNVSTNEAISINRLFKLMAEKYNYKKSPIYTKERTGDIKHSILDNKKCISLFGFAPKTSVKQGLANLFM